MIIMKRSLRIAQLSLLLVGLYGCTPSAPVTPDFTINGLDIYPITDLLNSDAAPDAESLPPAVAQVVAGDQVRLTDKSGPAAEGLDRSWAVSGRKLSLTEAPEVTFAASGRGLKVVKLCLGDQQCVEKYIYVNTPSDSDMASSDAADGAETPEPPAPEPTSSDPAPSPVVVIPEEPMPQRTSLVPEGPTQDQYPDRPQKDGLGSEETNVFSELPPVPAPSSDPPEQSPTPTPPPPPKPKALNARATIGPRQSDHSADCAKLLSSTETVTISPKTDIMMRAFAIHAEHCGRLQLTLSGPGVSVTESFELFGGMVPIPLEGFRERLQAEESYRLKFVTSTAPSCPEGLGAPRLAGAGSCTKTKLSSEQLTTSGSADIIYGFQYYH